MILQSQKNIKKITHSHAHLQSSTTEHTLYDFSGVKYEQTLKRYTRTVPSH
jgi:hypothetical protein